MKVHVSQYTADLLQGSRYIVEERGEAQIKVHSDTLSLWNICCSIAL